jgi:rubredoxin
VLDEVYGTQDYAGDFVRFFETGAAAQGAFQCSDCGYGVSVQTRLPLCPMCGGSSWERLLRGGPWQTPTRPDRR